jgi:hypothetical protein
VNRTASALSQASSSGPSATFEQAEMRPT